MSEQLQSQSPEALIQSFSQRSFDISGNAFNGVSTDLAKECLRRARVNEREKVVKEIIALMEERRSHYANKNLISKEVAIMNMANEIEQHYSK